MRCLRFVALATLLGLACAAPTISTSTLTVSGISAGGAMTVQFQVAHSSKVQAAGVVAGLPYGCAGSMGISGAFECMDAPTIINVAALDAAIRSAASAGQIDPVSNLQKQSALLFSGTMDTVVNHGSMIALATQLSALQLATVETIFNYTAEHAWITNDWGNSCSTLSSPYINNCGYDFAGEFFNMSWTSMNLTFNPRRGTASRARLHRFNQTAFGANGFTNSLDSAGFYYVPEACAHDSNESVTCHVHLNFHGCEQSHSNIGTVYVVNSGLNEWAESNNVIVVYPQAVSNSLLENPNACFDWWGYAGSDYATKTGVQVAFANRVVEHLMQHGALPVVE